MAFEIVERGDVFFLYRPKVELTDVECLGEVQAFFVVLSPAGGWHRLLRVGRKRLPEVRLKQRAWAAVEEVSSRAEAFDAVLRGEVYATKTRGERHQGPARAAGEGAYALVQHGTHLHFVYALRLPQEPGPCQDQLRIKPRGSFLLVARRPDLAPDAPRTFEAATPALLDRVGTDLVLIAVRDDLDVALDAGDATPDSAAIHRALRTRENRVGTLPLTRGQWE